MEYKYDETSGLYKKVESDTNIDIKSIEVGERINISTDLILKFMIYRLYQDKIKAEEREYDMKIRRNAAERAATVHRNDMIKKCSICKIMFNDDDAVYFNHNYFCNWCNKEHCGNCLPRESRRDCPQCDHRFSTKCVIDNKYCCGDERCK